ncbi:HHIP-like protein 1 [Gracilariopsis chorda]|uniref:HHIP-like protein 1 n=1 Tax=Gracilariopsis chorda TaxID=448386 RepID=A0A2V3J5B8_9FLOR|nr:HHIP-like protein 1 [Gracilariopsis chorda]|eukprot:PXF49564.1 HHIP-like protein 1 [Gracilariopsis chorda]
MLKLLLMLLLSSVHCFQPSPGVVNSVKSPIINGNRVVQTRLFAQIPDWNGKPARVNFITSHGPDLYVCTDTTGGLIYKVTPWGQVSMFFNVADAIFRTTGRRMSFANRIHGGLRSLAFHPLFSENGLLYVSAMEEKPTEPWRFRYLSTPPKTARADSVVIEFRYDFKQNRVLSWTYREVLRIGVPVFDHPIRQIGFYWRNLYISHGDGSVQSATAGGGQRNDALGKILRINPLKHGNQPYSIPFLNPFVNTWRMPEIYATGFRNPHNFCFGKWGELFVTDVGRDNFEEINIVKPGANYGWSEREGNARHLPGGGLLSGIAPLPWNDSAYGYTYPNVILGHAARYGRRFVGQAISSSCPIENTSPLSNTILFSNFPTGDMYYSLLSEMRFANTTGAPWQLSSARVFRPRIFFDHDNNPNTPPIRVQRLLDIVQMDPRFASEKRVDVRFGRGPSGEIYWSSKKNGRIYLITNSM